MGKKRSAPWLKDKDTSAEYGLEGETEKATVTDTEDVAPFQKKQKKEKKGKKEKKENASEPATESETETARTEAHDEKMTGTVSHSINLNKHTKVKKTYDWEKAEEEHALTVEQAAGECRTCALCIGAYFF